MHEILFRAKRLSNGEEVFGDFMTRAVVAGTWKKNIIRSYYMTHNGGTAVHYEIDRRTLSRYIGIRDDSVDKTAASLGIDSKGIKIFENDIVDVYQYDEVYYGRYLVSYVPDNYAVAQFDLVPYDDEYNRIAHYNDEGAIFVVGNRFDGKEYILGCA